jgi:putative ABC transport system permease protein
MPGANGQNPSVEVDDREITAMLLRFRSPLAAVTLPRLINSGPDLTAASPAYETARLLGFIGIGLTTVRGFGVLLILTAGLGLFIALYTALKTRQWDLAVMRSLGASRGKVMAHVLLEGVLLAAAGALLGLLLGHVIAEVLGQALRQAGEMGITGRVFYTEELALFGLMLLVGALAALIPAWSAYRVDIARTLARTR